MQPLKLASQPMALSGGLWFMYLLGYNFSVAAAVVAGLLPIMFGSGTGSEVMRRIAAPMVGGMASALVLTMLVLPAVYLVWEWHRIRRTGG